MAPWDASKARARFGFPGRCCFCWQSLCGAKRAPRELARHSCGRGTGCGWGQRPRLPLVPQWAADSLLRRCRACELAAGAHGQARGVSTPACPLAIWLVLRQCWRLAGRGSCHCQQKQNPAHGTYWPRSLPGGRAWARRRRRRRTPRCAQRCRGGGCGPPCMPQGRSGAGAGQVKR